MRTELKRSAKPHPERGAAMVLVAISMVALIGFVALAVDLGYLLVTRNEVQNVADASALAGARALGGIYQNLPNPEQQDFTCEEPCQAAIRAAAQDVATRNRAAGAWMTVLPEEVFIGRWDGNTFQFQITNVRPDAVWVIARRDDDANDPVSTFFARVLGIDEVPVNGEAIAAMTGQGTAWEGEVELPIGISRWFFDSRPDETYCNEDVQFYPTNDPASCAGWTSWEYNSNDAMLRKILEDTLGYTSPEILSSETIFNFTGGTLSTPTFDALLTLFQKKGFATDADHNFLLEVVGDTTVYVSHPPDTTKTYLVEKPGGGESKPVPIWEVEGSVQAEYPDGDLRYMHRWDTTIPVYDRDDCSNPNQSILIVGFAQIELTDVLNAPDKLVRGKVLCNLVSPQDNRGGGGNYGLKGPIPSLVK
jgi:hypothetical protein